MSSTPYSGGGGRAIDRVADALRGAGLNFKTTRTGGGVHIQASCPIHGADRNPSLSIDQHPGEDRVRLYCQTCADAADERDLVEAIGLRYDELWDEPGGECVWCHKRTIPDPDTHELIHPRCADLRVGRTPSQGSVSRLPPPKAAPAKPGRLPGRVTKDWPQLRQLGRRRPVATYEHESLDADGVLTVVGRSVRTEATYQLVAEDGTSTVETRKGMHLEHPDPAAPHGWAARLPDAAQISLWRPAELAAAIADRVEVWLAEGHKDAARLIEAGVVATTNINGAGNFNEHHAEQLRGAHVVVVCDRDLAGWRRGLKSARLLDGVAAAVRIVLPATPAIKSDAYDHLEQGYTVSEFVPTSVAELETLVLVGESEALLSNLESVPREIMARQHRAAAAADDPARAVETAAADRWAVEAGRLLVRIGQHRAQLAEHPAHTAEQLATMETLIVAATDITVEAHRACELPLPDEVNQLLAADADESSDNTTDLSSRREVMPEPEYRIPISGRAAWAYSLGEGNTARAVYHRATANHPWQVIGPLPHVEARLIRRDANDDKCGVDYLIGLAEDSPHITATTRTLNDGTWANQLGIPLSADPQVVRAVATAITYHSDADVPAHESTARISILDGRIEMPPDLPSGWLETSPAGPERAVEAWRAIAAEATPVMAHVFAASAFAPFLRDVGTQPHVISLSGGQHTGKSLTLMVAAAIWGNSINANNDLYDNWNTTAKGTPLMLGSQRMLPSFRDEAGLAALTGPEWGVLLYAITQGASRTRGTRDGGATRTPSWRGIFFSTGNGEMLAGAEGGVFDGLGRRLIDFDYRSFTADRDQAKRLLDGGRGLLPDCYGHLGQMIIDRYTLTRVRDLIADANRRLQPADGATGHEIRDLLLTHVAGAMMLDELLGTGELITAKTVEHAETYLDGIQEVTEGDRLLDRLLQSMSSRRNSWPTRDQYLALTAPYGDDKTVQLPKGGINAGNVIGVRVEELNEVWAFTDMFREVARDLNLRVGLRDLEARGIFWRQPKKRSGNEFPSQKALGEKSSTGKRGRIPVYVFRLDNLPDEDTPPTGGPAPDPQTDRNQSDHDPVHNGPVDNGPVELFKEDDNATPTAGITGSDNRITGRITGEITGDNAAVTRRITGITGNSGQALRDVGAGARVREDAPAPPVSRAAQFTPERTADWTMEQLEDALATAWEDPDTVAAIEQLIDARDTAERQARQQPRTGPPTGDSHTGRPAVRPAGTSPRSGAPRPASDHAPDPATPDHHAGAAGPDGGRPGIVPAPPLRQPRDPRFVAPAAVLDGTTLHLPGGRRHTWTARHLGDLAVLAHEQTGLRLGWGGGDALPDQGQLWLYPDAIAALGLPARMDLPEKAYFDDERNQALAALYAPLKDHPAVTAAIADGWELQQSRLDAWTRLRHPDLLPGGAIVVFLPWWRMAGVPLLDGDPDPATLAERLHGFAQTTGVAYRVNSGITGLALIDHTRPPRRSPGEPSGRAVRMVRNEPAPLPPFLYDQSDQRFSSIETDYLWWRLWEPTPGSSRHALLPSETEQAYVHGYDRGASHLGGWHVEVGVDGLAHLGADAVWNGKTSQAGIWLVDLWDWDEWGLPDPAVALNARVDGGRVWVTTPTLAQLKLHGITPTISEAWVWDKSNRYLDLAAKVLADARKHPDPLIVKTIKDVYTRTNGKIGEPRRWPTQQHLNRRDWYFTIVAQSRFAIDLTLTKINRETGAMPLAVDHDAVFFASDHPDPIAGWPGDPTKLGTGVGQWKPIGSAHLADWGPAHLTEGRFQPGQPLRRGWRYKEAADDLTPPGAWRARQHGTGQQEVRRQGRGD